MKPQVDQVGGLENYKLYKKMMKDPRYAENVKQSLEAQIASLSGEDTGTETDTNTAPAATGGTLSESDIAAIKKDAYVDGSDSADILWIEYSDLECPYCKALHDSKAISNLQTKYGDKLAFMFKHYPLPFHPNALPAAQSAECVAKEGGAEKYYAFVDAVFAKGTATQAIIDSAVTEIGLDSADIKACADGGEFKTIIDASMSEGSSKFGVNGTPGNVLINTKTGKYEVVSGAQPEANFDAAIVRLLAE